MEKSIWVDMKNMIEDVLTKESAPTFLITEILIMGIFDKGVLNKDVFYGMKEVLDYSVLNKDVLYGVLDSDAFNDQTGEQKEAREDWHTRGPSANVLIRS